MGYSDDIPETHVYGGFHYTTIHAIVSEDNVGSFFQSGMMHTWYKPSKIYDLKDYAKDTYGYHTIEGGAGYKPYLHFHNYYTPQKFTMGGVAGGFYSFSNGPSAGAPNFKNSKSESLGWDENRGRYGTAALSNRILFPLDGIGFKAKNHNKMLGYGYYALPLTEPKSTTAGQNIPTGNKCWTLFLNTENFSGPVAFYTPYFWSKYSLSKATTKAKCLDNSLLKLAPVFQRETNNLPAKKWVASNGDVYYKCSPVLMPIDEDTIGRLGTMPMNMDNTMWDAMSRWFEGGAVANTNFNAKQGAIHIRKSLSLNTYYRFNNAIRVRTSDYVSRIQDPKDPYAAAFKWNLDKVKKVEGRDLVQLPEYYVLRNGTKLAVSIAEEKVPDISGLKQINSRKDYEADWNYTNFPRKDINTPIHPNYTYHHPLADVWKSPGPASGPYFTDLNDSSTAVYYWYKFNEQPAILNSDMDEEERKLIQQRVELIHQHWRAHDHYFPSPSTKEKISLDYGLLVTPPPGFEQGYVPICVHQQLSSKPLPNFPEVNLYRPPLKVYILAGQSNMVGQGRITDAELTGTLAYTLKNDKTGNYDFLDDGKGGYAKQSDVWIYFEHKDSIKSGQLAPGYGNDQNKIGVELTFGQRMQAYTKQQILIIKSAWGGKSLAKDFRPPSAKGETGEYYKEMLRVIDDALKNIKNNFPAYNEQQGYEIAGMVWHQGWNDHVKDSYIKDYTKNLSYLIRDLRSDLGVNFPVVIATTAMPMRRTAFGDNKTYKKIELAQLAIADKTRYPAFEGNVAVVDAKQYWISPNLSPCKGGGQHYHWNQNAKSYMDMGFGIADAMYRLQAN